MWQRMSTGLDFMVPVLGERKLFHHEFLDSDNLVLARGKCRNCCCFCQRLLLAARYATSSYSPAIRSATAAHDSRAAAARPFAPSAERRRGSAANAPSAAANTPRPPPPP